MDKQELQIIKEELIKQKKRIEKDLASFAEKKPQVNDDFDTRFPNYGDDVDSNVAEVDSFAASLSLERNLEHMLRDINQALTNIERDTYGRCQQCGKQIQEARLRAFPAATHCMKCQE